MTKNTLPKAASGTGPRVSVINAVQTPLGFFALALLIVEAVLGAIAISSGGIERTIAMGIMALGVFTIVALVAYFAYHRPEALSGSRYHPTPPAEPPPPAVVAERPVKLEAADTRIREPEYTGPSISGKWRVKYMENGEGYAEFQQVGNRVGGKLVVYKSKSSRDIMRSFDISGWFASGRLTATYEDTDSRGLVVGALALELYHDRTKMEGKVIFFGGQGDKPVIDYDITLLWNPA